MPEHQHVWTEEYYGWLCVPCGLFYPFGGAPWEVFDEFDDDDGVRDERDILECGDMRAIAASGLRAARSDADDA